MRVRQPDSGSNAHQVLLPLSLDRGTPDRPPCLRTCALPLCSQLLASGSALSGHIQWDQAVSSPGGGSAGAGAAGPDPLRIVATSRPCAHPMWPKKARLSVTAVKPEPEVLPSAISCAVHSRRPLSVEQPNLKGRVVLYHSNRDPNELCGEDQGAVPEVALHRVTGAERVQGQGLPCQGCSASGGCSAGKGWQCCWVVGCRAGAG